MKASTLPGLFSALCPGPSIVSGTFKNVITICWLNDPTGASVTPWGWILAVPIVSQLHTQPPLLCDARDGVLQTSFLLCQQLCESAKMEILREAASLEGAKGLRPACLLPGLSA